MAERTDLVRSLVRWDVSAVVINGVIGASIFGLPSTIFALLGSFSIFAFVACAFCSAVLVLCFAEVASRFSKSGGPYLYAREAFGPTVGFTVGWLVWVARVSSFAANSNLLLDYLDRFLPGASSGLLRYAILTAVVLSLGLLNMRGIRTVANMSNLLAVGKLLPLLIFIVVGFFFLDPARFVFSPVPAFGRYSPALLLLIYSFGGFEMAVIPAGEVHSPERSLPSTLLFTMAAVVTIYVLIQIVCIGTLPELAASKRPLADAAEHFLGVPGVLMITAGIVVSLIGNLNILILSSSRILFAMAEQKALPPWLAVIHQVFRTPLHAVAVTIVAILVLTLSGTFIYLLTLSALARLVTYLVTCASLPVLRRHSGSTAWFVLPGGPAIAVVGILICIWLLSASSGRAARDTLIATAAGLVIYFVTTRVYRSAN